MSPGRDTSRRVEGALEQLRGEFPKLRVVDKDASSFCKILDRALRVITFGGQSAFMTRYVTTIGHTIYVPTGWSERDEADRYATLRHEAVHLRQFRRYGRIGMSVMYLLPILPMGLAWGRARLEWQAYEETLRAVAELQGIEAARALKPHIMRQFVGAAYGWMWPFPRAVGRWVDRAIDQIHRELG